jgi:hypothetical protein
LRALTALRRRAFWRARLRVFVTDAAIVSSLTLLGTIGGRLGKPGQSLAGRCNFKMW